MNLALSDIAGATILAIAVTWGPVMQIISRWEIRVNILVFASGQASLDICLSFCYS